MKLEALELPLNVIDSGFKAGIAAAIAGTTALIGAMGTAVKMTFDWADELDGLQDVMGVTNEEAAALNFTLRKSGVGVETLSKGMVILEKGLVKADGTLDTTGKALKSWGINVKDVNGKLKGQTALIGDISKKYNSFATQQEKVNFLTEVFGRSGAELIDFFDTLGAEGGIDTVTEKVKRLGLVIDPGRYENFTRALEELKLVGLGLAVGFTEKVMPVLEWFMQVITAPGHSPAEKLGFIATELDKVIGNIIFGFAESIDNWIASGGPEQLSDKLVSWIENIGKGPGTETNIEAAAWYLVDRLAEAFKKVDWQAIGTAIDNKVAEGINSVDWSASGDALGASIEKLLTGKVEMTGGLFGEWFRSAATLGIDRLIAFFQDTATGQAVANAIAGFYTSLDARLGEFQARIQENSASFLRNLAVTWTNGITRWGQDVYNKIVEWINKIIVAGNSMPFAVRLPTIPTTNTTASNHPGKRASGGPVVGGQTYSVAEFFKPEVFTPAVNGRVDKMPQAQAFEFDYDRLGDLIGLKLGVALQKYA